MAKPSFPFYPDDWMNDLGLRACSPLSRAIWMDLLCLMHQGVPYGHMAESTGPLPVKLVAARCCVTVKQLGAALSELEAHNVFSRTDAGVIFSRRMVRDEYKRTVRGNGGKGAYEAYLASLQQLNGKPPFDARGKPPFDPVKVEVKEIETSEQQKTALPSLKFEQWWSVWSRVRGTNHRFQAEHAYFQYVTEDIEEACMACTESYLAGLENPGKGYNPENFLADQARDHFAARWPAHISARKMTVQEGLLAEAERRIASGEIN